MPYWKNVAGQNLGFAMISTTTGLGVAGLTVSGYRNLDNGGQAAVTGTITSAGNGQYNLALSQADTNGNNGSFLFTATGAVTIEKSISFQAGLYQEQLVWLDTNNGTTGIVLGTNGTQNLPSNTIANATTIAGALGTKRFQLLPESSITLAQAYRDYYFGGENYTLILNGQDVSACTFVGGAFGAPSENFLLSGIALAAYDPPTFIAWGIGTATLPACTIKDCTLTGTLTLATSGGTFYLLNCCGGASAVIDLGASHSAVTLQLRNWYGALTIKHILAGDTVAIDGSGSITLDTTCTGGTVGFHGPLPLTNSGSGMTISQTARISTDNTTNLFSVNATQVAGDGTAPGNIANTFNGTGYVAATAPAQQQQVANIAITGAALNQIASSFVQTTGSVTSGTYANTATADGVYHITADAAGTLNEYYQFNIGAYGVGTSVDFIGYLTSAINSMKVYAYNWGTAAWDQIGTITGTGSIVVNSAEWDLTTAHTGTGGNLGLVQIRFGNTGLVSSSLGIDRLLVGYATVQQFPSNFATMAIDTNGRIDLGKIIGNATAAQLLQYLMLGITTDVVASATGTTSFTGTATPATANYFGTSGEGQFVLWVTGANIGQSQRISGYTSGRIFTMANPFSVTPTAGDRYVIVGQASN